MALPYNGAPPDATTFRCDHKWKGPDADGFYFCKQCRGYWHPKMGWTREIRRVKKLMTDEYNNGPSVPHERNAMSV